jgi:hypothetical protein
MRVLNDAEDVSEWVEDRCYSNAAADFLHGGALRSATADQAVESRLSVRNAPVRTEPDFPPGVPEASGPRPNSADGQRTLQPA